MRADLGMFGIDEVFGLEIAQMYGTIGQTNFGDIDVNKPGVVKRLNDDGKQGNAHCHTFLDDVVGALAAAASTRVAQIISEEESAKDPHFEPMQLPLEWKEDN
jgi:phosphatidylglycerophosphatase A